MPRVWDGSWRALGRSFRWKAGESPEAGLLRSLDALMVATRPDEVTLGEWFTRWDSGPSPLVIDRMSLVSAGWGPKSRVVPPRFTSPRAGAALATLRSIGLTVVPIGGTLLITGQRDAPDRPGGPLGDSGTRAEWEDVVNQAIALGYDRSDRFQSVTRWRGEATPKVSIQGETTESEPAMEGWRYWRFAAPGWPDALASVHLVDEHRRAGQAWALALAIVLAGIAGRRAAPLLRAPALTLLLAAAILALALSPARVTPIAWGALAGLLGVGFLCLGQSVSLRLRRREPRARATVRRLNSGVTTALLLIAAMAALVPTLPTRLAIAQDDGNRPIIALLPYDGPPDPDRRPDRVILRREDAERLQSLSATGPALSPNAVRALTASHKVYRTGERDIAVESRYSLLGCDSGRATSWTFPVEDATEITAQLDGHPVPVQVQPAGRTAVVMLDGSASDLGRSRRMLQIRRIVGLRHGVSEDVLHLAINPVATAEVVVVDDLPGRANIEVPSARGRIAPRVGVGGVAGLLGPADRLEVRWSATADPGPVETAGAVEGLLLWDALPAGDHVQARLTYQKSGGTSTIRLGLDPGLIVRAGSLPGLVDATWQGSDEHPEWVASIDPPLADGATIQLEFWRQVPRSAPEARVLPRIEPLGVERYSGALGFRRPTEWSGRLPAGGGLEPMTEEALVKAWGNLPDAPLTLAGATRFAGLTSVSIATGPPHSQLLVDPEVQLTIESGRIAVNLSAGLSSVAGRCDHVELALPPGLELVTVEAEGLSDWSQTVPDRVLVRFDGPLLHRRELRIQAWLPVLTDPLAMGVTNPEIDIPWPRWVDAEVRPGQLTIVSPTRFQLVQSSGTAPLQSASTGNRAVYRVDRPEALGRLTWEVEPPRLGVLVQSQMTVLADYAEWVAVLRYDVSGGGAEAVHLKLPAAWAASARVQVVGDTHRLTTETRGPNTFWMIRPDHPIWGSQRLIVRSALPLPKTGALNFPDLSPLGRWGVVDTYLALANASGARTGH